MPSRRIFRRKSPIQPMSAFIWRFFLIENIEDLDELAAVQGDEAEWFFLLYYMDGWRSIYAQHHEEIEQEWRRRGWSKKKKKFVLTDYRLRGFVLAHDRRRERESELWREWQRIEGWKSKETFVEFRDRRMQEEDLREQELSGKD